MTKQVTARFTCAEVLWVAGFRRVKLSPVYSSDKSDPNYSWSQATPSGSIELTITNPAAFEQFVPGTLYHITFEALPAPTKGT